MNTPDNFDELSRRKLAEREFPFDEGHWLDVQRSLNAERQRKAAWLPWAIGAALLVGAGAWLAIRGGDEPTRTVQVAQENVPAQVSSETTTVQTGSAANTSDQGGANGAPGGGVAESNEPTSIATIEEGQAQNRNDERKELDRSEQLSTRSQVPSSTAMADVVGHSEKPSALEVSTNAFLVPKPVVTLEATGSDAGTTSVVEPLQEETMGTSAPANAGIEGAAHAEIIVQENVSAPVQSNAPQTTEGSNVPVALGTPTEAAVEAPAATGDTSLASTAPITLPRTDPTGRWEISALGGALSTASAYAGGNSVQWTNALSNAHTATLGVELMRMGKNTGIGTGVHYSQYAENFNEADRFRTDIDYRNYYFLQTFDTTVTIIVGIDTIGGDTAYITQQVDTSISTLGTGVDTVTTTTLQSAARKHVNVVSYLEIPLLLDAHLVQGRWSIGVRGGPFLGVLSGRRGALPNSGWDGYTDLADQPFRSLVFGYTARAYVRYRFNAAWSVGFEPCIRGQLINAYSSGDITRRSTGFGALLSLSYSLR